MKIADLPQVGSLSVEEKISLVGELWDQIAKMGEAVPLPEWHKPALDQSLAEYRENPRAGSTWTEARTRILRRK